eukprot:513385_1
MPALLLLIVWSRLLCKVSPSENNHCQTHFTCNNCIQDVSCGWCQELEVCVPDDANGTYSGNCEWYYNMCPPLHDISWYAFGGSQRHHGYVPYTTKITENTEKKNKKKNINKNI